MMVSSMTLNVGLFSIGILGLSCLSSAVFQERNNEATAQSYVQTIKYRNLVIDLGNGLKANAIASSRRLDLAKLTKWPKKYDRNEEG